MHQIYRRTPKRKCDFNKVAKQLREGYSPANLLHNFRTTFLENNSGWLLLDYHSESNSKKENKKYEENKKNEYGKKTKNSENDIPTEKNDCIYFRRQYDQKTKWVPQEKRLDLNSLSKFIHFQALK